MPLQAPTAAPRRLASFVLLSSALAFAGCENVPPYLDRVYVRASTQALTERLEADDENSNGPFPGIGATVGSMLAVERTRSTAMEFEAQAYLATGDLDGYGFRYSAGPRWFWNEDGRMRPNASVGAHWTDFHLEDHDRSFDPNGPGGYGDFGLDWMITPHHGIGGRLRGTLRYERADHNHGLKLGLEFAIQSVWRF